MLATVFMLLFILLVVYRCVPADAVPLMRDDIIHGDGVTGYLVLASEKMFVLSFDAFTFMGPSRKLYFSCVMCLNNCEMVSDVFQCQFT